MSEYRKIIIEICPDFEGDDDIIMTEETEDCRTMMLLGREDNELVKKLMDIFDKKK